MHGTVADPSPGFKTYPAVCNGEKMGLNGIKNHFGKYLYGSSGYPVMRFDEALRLVSPCCRRSFHIFRRMEPFSFFRPVTAAYVNEFNLAVELPGHLFQGLAKQCNESY